jgi:hypothetical protein
MARDDTARNSNRESSLLDRRSYLKLAGATAATAAGAGAAASAGAASYDIISVSAGETRRISVGDAFAVEGSVASMSLDESKWTIRYGGSETTVAELTDSGDSATEDGDDSGESADSTRLHNRLVVDGTDKPNQSANYSFAVSGEVQKSAELGSVNRFDSVNGAEVEGRVVGGKDGFRFSGEVTQFRLEGSASVEVQDGS